MDDSARICFICKRREDNQLDLGNWMAIENVHVHYFCLVRNAIVSQVKRSANRLLCFYPVYK